MQDGLTLDATLTVAGNADGIARLSFVGTQTVSGNGLIAMTGSDNNVVAIDAENATVTLGPDVTLHGQGDIDGLANATLLNQGTFWPTLRAEPFRSARPLSPTTAPPGAPTAAS